MIRRPAMPVPSARWRMTGAVLAVAAGYVVWDAMVRSRHVLEVTASYGVTVDAPAADPASPTGYAQGRRSMVLPVGAADTYHWIMQTQAMIARGDWRIRRVDYDNSPAGREVHWGAPLHWWLAGLAWADHQMSGRPVGRSVERAALYSGPVMLGLVLLGLGIFLHRRFSATAAGWFAFGAVSVFPFYLDFTAGYADHHGLANICGLLTVLFLLAGTAAPAGRARRWFAASGLAGGAGLWISAATQVPVLIGIGAGVVVAGGLARRVQPRPVWLDDPGLWQTWGGVGGGVSLAAYLFEYFPRHFGMRLEVNHPLYAVAWIGAGVALRVALVAWRDGARALRPSDRAVGAGAVVLVALLPVTVLLTAAQTFTVADPFLWRLHAAHISEFQSLGRLLARGVSWSTVALCLPMLLLVPPLGLALRGSTPGAVRARLALALAPALLATIMGWTQVRWMSLAFALTVPVIAEFFRESGPGAARSRAAQLGWLLAGCLVLVPGAVQAVQRTIQGAEITPADIRTLASRDVAHWLGRRSGEGRVVVAGSPTPTTKLVFHGGLTGLGTLYWENAAGLKQVAELYAAPTDAAAREIAGRVGLTHLVFFSWDTFEPILVQLQRGLPASAPPPADAFIVSLLQAPVPPAWLRPVPFRLPAHPVLAGASVRVWEVGPEQTPAAALAGAANYFLELDRIEEAGRLAPALARFEDDLAASAMLAGIASRQRNEPLFREAFGRILAGLARAGSLSLDEHVHLVVVLTVGQRLDLAREQLRLCLAKVDAGSLRRLTPGTLADLLALSDGLGLALPGELQPLAAELLPPDRRK